jgi:glycosyltransferase involved in cell wall biosynthesis
MPDSLLAETADQLGSPAMDERPATVLDIELSLPISSLRARTADGRLYREAWLVVRLFGEPIGLLTMQFVDDELSVAQICEAIQAECGDLIRERVSGADGDIAAVLRGDGTATTSTPTFLADHFRWASEGPHMTVVICTRNRATDLERALASLARQSYSQFDVLVVDNAPADSSTEQLISRLVAGGREITYVREPRPGLSWARNCALARITAPVVAWLDDDEVADVHWLMELAGAFCEHPGAVAVSGSVVPAELETQPQMWFEEYGGHTKGRGFAPAVFHGRNTGEQNPLYPLPAFGVGANMAFRTATLRGIGGFDPALGAGTGTLGGEDTLMFSQVLLRGGTVVYRPTALTRHYHRPDYEALAKQMRGYGIGLTAFYASLLRYDWRLIVGLVRLAPRALRDTFGSSGQGMASVSSDFPAALLKLKTRGMLKGPFAYLRARRVARRLGRGVS